VDTLGWGYPGVPSGIYRGSRPLRAPALAVRCLQRAELGASALSVSRLCFGTMLFGEGNSYPEAARLLGACREGGVNFFDSAEMYPVPQSAETHGRSEEYLGRWVRESGVPRDQVVLATKVAGPSGQMTWIRGGPQSLDASNITEAIDGSLRRLGTDYIDLLQLHWPDRYVPMFGDVEYDPTCAYSAVVPAEEQLEALGRAVEAGKVREVGLSNETPWGLMKFLQAAGSGRPRVASLQNAYSLLCRTFEGGLAECCHLEAVALLAYSPLAMGLLTGKYHPGSEEQGGGAGPGPEARLVKYAGRYAEAESRYYPRAPNVAEAVREYGAIAREAGMSPAELAIRWVLTNPQVASAVVGASNERQLKELLRAGEAGALPPDVAKAVDAVHRRYPSPTP